MVLAFVPVWIPPPMPSRLHTSTRMASPGKSKVLRFSDRSYIEGGVFHDPSGERAQIEPPHQVFTRWYGFALTFPETEIWGDGSGR